ncbi:MAG: PIN domain-containing protein, partial [Gemmatimonadales bacterium]
MLDTSVLVAAERRALRMGEMLQSLGEEPVALAAITASELLHGCYRATEPGVRARRWAFVEGLLQAIPVLPFGLA